MIMNPKKTLSKEDKEFFLNIKWEDITLEFLQGIFADKYDPIKKKIVPSKYNTYDEFSLKKGEYFNKTDIPKTNCGLFIVNKFLFEKDLSDVVGYINEPFSDDMISSVGKKLDYALLNDKITTDVYIDYLNNLSWLAYSFNTEVSTSLTIHAMRELPEVHKAKEKLLKENKEKIEVGDVTTASMIEKELIKVGKEAMKNDTAMDLYDSGARGGFNVAYKNAQIMKGPVYNESKKKFEIMTNPLIEGIEKDNVPALANNCIDSAYGKAIASGECGYLTKKIVAGCQTSVLDKKGSDCGTKMYSEITLTKGNIGYYQYCYMVEGSKLVRLDPTNQDKYIGKKVKMRTNNFCISKEICNKCGGDIFYMLGVDNIGLTGGRISNTLLNYRMKAMHDSTVHTYELDIANDFIKV